MSHHAYTDAQPAQSERNTDDEQDFIYRFEVVEIVQIE